MSRECQVIGGPYCTVGKTCPNENCDYKICDCCAEKILEYNDELFDIFKCPACTRPVKYRFSNPKRIFKKIHNCFKNLWEMFSPSLFAFCVVWSALCWGRLVSFLLGHIGYWTDDSEFFNEQFFLYAVLGWIAFCFSILLSFIALSAICFLLGFIIIVCEAIYIECIDIHYRSVIID